MLITRNYKIHQRSRARYQYKRSTQKWKKRKKRIKTLRLLAIFVRRKFAKKIYHNCESPEDFSFINNTNDVLSYFNWVTEFIHKKQSVNLDISKITNLTPDTITLLVAKLGEKESRKVGMSGNAPENPLLRRMFLESGLYNFVNSKVKKRRALNNKLWKHSTNNKVRGEMAGEAIAACRNLFSLNGKIYDTDNLYNLLVEAMSNTMNHADKKRSNINWWLYYYIEESTQTLKYSFIDLGIGIFNSANFESFRNIAKHLYIGNQLLVEPFLEGKIISSRETDREISGKGVKQIISCANLPEFTKFIIITNDIKIDVKTRQSERLYHNFEGTFIYFEISCNYDN